MWAADVLKGMEKELLLATIKGKTKFTCGINTIEI